MGIQHSRLGNSLLHIPQREYHQHMTRAPLTLRCLACCLPLQPFHTENACVDAYVSWIATSNTPQCPWTMRNHTEDESGRGEIWGEKEEVRKSDEGHQNMLVSGCYATNVTKWLMEGFFVPQEFPLIHLLFFVNSSITLVPRTHLFSSKKIHLIFLSFSSVQA